ncbi:MAG: TIGR04563 family protein [Myxococcales bacterium]|nr:TIGR04563 family protein [Myxococcales bacterium]
MSSGVKQSLYFPEEMLEEIQREAKRQDRSISWIVQQAWRVARSDLRKVPSTTEILSEPRKKIPSDDTKP